METAAQQDAHSLQNLSELDDVTSSRLAEVFKVLGDPTRIKQLALLTTDEMRVSDIASALNMGQSAISHQLRLLRDRSLVTARREGQRVIYSLSDDHVGLLIEIGLQHAAEEEGEHV